MDKQDELAGKWREAGLKAMQEDGFTFLSVRLAISFAHGPHDGIYRFADRLLQSERRAGRIETCPDNKRKWRRAALSAAIGEDIGGGRE